MKEQHIKQGWLSHLTAEELAQVEKTNKNKGALQAGDYYSWDWDNDGSYFVPREQRDNMEPRGLAIRGFKKEVEWLFKQGEGDLAGFQEMDYDGFYGKNAVANVKKIQTLHGLTADGVIGIRTTKAIVFLRVANFEAERGGIAIPDHLLGRTIILESGLYLACRNTYSYPEIGQFDLDPNGDHSLVQIHAPLSAYFSDGSEVCPDDDWQFAYRVGVNVRVLGEEMRRNYRWLKPQVGSISESDLWRAVVMAHNAPYWALPWAQNGFPTSGGGTVTVGNWTGDKYTWCELYTTAVYNRTW